MNHCGQKLCLAQQGFVKRVFRIPQIAGDPLLGNMCGHVIRDHVMPPVDPPRRRPPWLQQRRTNSRDQPPGQRSAVEHQGEFRIDRQSAQNDQGQEYGDRRNGPQTQQRADPA
eukprot:gene36277-46415_t